VIPPDAIRLIDRVKPGLELVSDVLKSKFNGLYIALFKWEVMETNEVFG
jgi:hypothetical protein